MSEQTMTQAPDDTQPDGDVLLEARDVNVLFPIKRGVIFD